MKKQKIVAMTLLVAMLMPMAVSAVSSTSYGNKVTMYAPDGRTISVSVYDVEKWKAVGWYEQPGSSKIGYTSTNSSYYPNTTIPSFDSYGTFLHQRFSGDNIIWIYYASVDNSNRYLSNLESNGFVLIAKEEENNTAKLGYYKSSTNEIVAFVYDYKNSWFGIIYHL